MNAVSNQGSLRARIAVVAGATRGADGVDHLEPSQVAALAERIRGEFDYR